MKIPFFGRNSNNNNNSADKLGQQDSTKEPAVPTTYAAEFRGFVARNAPSDFEGKFSKARPFVFASFIAWPMYWLYKGLDWGRHRNKEKLQTYINRTFLQAKVIQIAIITAGILVATYDNSEYLQTMAATHVLPKPKDGEYSGDD